ncbi:TPA: hypothetical protein ACWYG6_005230 [Citrobacter braakii]|uniref:hypothetical protein n=1 Tax=Citrobacter TaxID=544 RepID=UPI000E04055A|nr:MULTISPECIES: hypothetical protein [Citrobacter]MGI20295.1 hypothetical protein [Escherichia coli]MDE9667009.1 hypothetical protein [Citrobacter portucalensis]MDE9676811.1 hypothetical protein [Citrobacter portucalensis]MDM2903577.1 hypothetical protein [Citrobacter sp. Cpo037]STG11777.1 Uncharacterised protein [Escherichia coli]
MARCKAPRKRKPTPSSRRSRPNFPKRFLVSVPPRSDYDDPDEFFYDTPQDAIRHCVHLGPQFFLDTHFDPPLVCIIRGFEPPDSPDGDVVLESMPADVFIIATESGMLPVTFSPWDKHTDNWADDCDDWHYNHGTTAER